MNIQLLFSLIILVMTVIYVLWFYKLWDVIIKSRERIGSCERHLENLKEMVFDYHKED